MTPDISSYDHPQFGPLDAIRVGHDFFFSLPHISRISGIPTDEILRRTEADQLLAIGPENARAAFVSLELFLSLYYGVPEGLTFVRWLMNDVTRRLGSASVAEDFGNLGPDDLSVAIPQCDQIPFAPMPPPKTSEQSGTGDPRWVVGLPSTHAEMVPDGMSSSNEMFADSYQNAAADSIHEFLVEVVPDNRPQAKFDAALLAPRSFDGYVNATAICNATGRRFQDYMDYEPTADYLAELSREDGIPVTELVIMPQGGVQGDQEIWIHLLVAINLAQWCSPEFAVWVIRQMRAGSERRTTTGSQMMSAQQIYDLATNELARLGEIVELAPDMSDPLMQARRPAATSWHETKSGADDHEECITQTRSAHPNKIPPKSAGHRGGKLLPDKQALTHCLITIDKSGQSVPPPTLTTDDISYRDEREQIVTAAVASSIMAAKALHEIKNYRDGLIWKAQFLSFERYCEAKWGYKKSHAYRQLDVGGFIADLSDSPQGENIPQPVNAGQIRPLVDLVPKPHRVECWTSIMEGKDPAEFTGPMIADEARKFVRKYKLAVSKPKPAQLPTKVRATRELGKLKSILSKLPHPERFTQLLAGIGILINEDPPEPEDRPPSYAPEPGITSLGDARSAPQRHGSDDMIKMHGSGREDTAVHGGGAGMPETNPRVRGIDPDCVAEAMNDAGPPEEPPQTQGRPGPSVDPTACNPGAPANKIEPLPPGRKRKRHDSLLDNTPDLPGIDPSELAAPSDQYREDGHWVKTTPGKKQAPDGKPAQSRHQLMHGDQKVGRSVAGHDAGRKLRLEAQYLNSRTDPPAP